MSTIDQTALKTELTTDPLGRGYAAQVTAGHIDGLLSLLNGARSDSVVATTLSKDTFLLMTAQANFRIAALADGQTKDGWRELMQSVRAAVNIYVSQVGALLAKAVTDGILTQAEVDAVNAAAQRQVGRAEKLWGVPVTAEDVRAAVASIKQG